MNRARHTTDDAPDADATPDAALPSDEDLAARAADGDADAERNLLRRYMPAIYWLPRKAFAASEDFLSDFLLFAIEKLRDRGALARYDPQRGARFSTWFGVVIRNLYLDYLRTIGDRPRLTGLDTESVESNASVGAPDIDEDDKSADQPTHPDGPPLLRAMEMKCRVLFKLLLLNSFSLTGEELRWIADTSGRPVTDCMVHLARLEEDLCEQDRHIEERRQQLLEAHWWKSVYERRLLRMESEPGSSPGDGAEDERALRRRLEKRRAQHRRLLHDLSGGGGVATMPYRDMAALLQMKENTLGSHLTRCRQAVAGALGRNGSSRRKEDPS